MLRLLLFSIFIFCILNSSAQEYNRTIGNGNYYDVKVTTSSITNRNGIATLDGLGMMPNLAAASRFLAQSTLGTDYETIIETAEKGYSQWLDEQLNKPISFSLLDNCKSYIAKYQSILIENGEDSTIADGKDSNWVQNYFLFSWWKYVMTSEDMLRARVAFALSEIIVISAFPDLESQPLGLASFYDVLIRNSLGNYHDLLHEVTYHPMMGKYLTYMNNRKTNIDKNRFPDENYAREIMQLFTIGLYELNNNGNPKLNTDGIPIPTYDADDIKEFAKIFTGLSWGDRDDFGHSSSLVRYYSSTLPMQVFNEEHESGEKQLLNGLVIPNREPVNGDADIQDALDNLFNHQNVGPFLARKLIQRLVTSNPSAEYISRVASAFNDNGFGIRGDMKAVVKAILLDSEARSCASDYYSGKLKEPVIRHTQLLRSFNASSNSGEFRYTTGESYLDASDQRVLYSPSVFNFFLPDYQPVGEISDANLVAPEFQIVHSATIIGYANAVMKWTFENNLVGSTPLFPDEPVSDEDLKLQLDIQDELDLLLKGKNEELIERLNLVLMNGQMSEKTRNIILNTINEVSEESVEYQLNMAIFLTMISPEYLVLK